MSQDFYFMYMIPIIDVINGPKTLGSVWLLFLKTVLENNFLE